jgi:hypothetical protein
MGSISPASILGRCCPWGNGLMCPLPGKGCLSSGRRDLRCRVLGGRGGGGSLWGRRGR